MANSAANALAWDFETYMPAKSLSYRAEQLAWLTGRAHRQFIAGQVGQWIRSANSTVTSPIPLKRAIFANGGVTMTAPPNFQPAWWKSWSASAPARAVWQQARQQSKFALFTLGNLDAAQLMRRAVAAITSHCSRGCGIKSTATDRAMPRRNSSVWPLVNPPAFATTLNTCAQSLPVDDQIFNS